MLQTRLTRSVGGLCLLVALLCCQTGCVRRRMTIRTNPPGAVAYVDNHRIGVTPVSTSFTYYGTRKIELIKDGYETVRQYHKFSTPWYQWIGVDFFAENVWPFETRDERVLDFQLSPQRAVPPAEVMERAEQLRGSAQQELAVADPAAVAPSPAVLPPAAAEAVPTPSPLLPSPLQPGAPPPAGQGLPQW
jgi:hypothetical protein